MGLTDYKKKVLLLRRQSDWVCPTIERFVWARVWIKERPRQASSSHNRLLVPLVQFTKEWHACYHPWLADLAAPVVPGSCWPHPQMVTADWSTCTQAGVVQSAATICGCGQQLTGTQQVQPSQLTRGAMDSRFSVREMLWIAQIVRPWNKGWVSIIDFLQL